MRYTHSKLKKHPKLGELQQEHGSLTKDDSKKSQLLNNFFAGVFTREKLDNMPDLSWRHTGEPIVNLDFTAEMVEKKLKKLPPPVFLDF